jgi:MATE family multidrug resistance protein
VGTGIIRGLGRQGRASLVTITGYWILGIPVSLLGVFYFKWGITGLWLGPTIAIIFNFIFYYVLVVKTDWDQIADDAEKRRLKEKKQQ